VISWYDANASRLATAYEAVPPTVPRDWLAGLLPKPPALVIDVGAGTGRDAAAFAEAGYEVIAVEPSSGQRRHRKAPLSRSARPGSVVPTAVAIVGDEVKPRLGSGACPIEVGRRSGRSSAESSAARRAA
jgi:SAM-dependent methyltransferase